MLKSLRMLRALPFLAFIFLCAAWAQQQPAPATSQPSAQYTIPVEAARRPNPVKATPESIAEGKKLYGYDCAMCHGANGDGKGDIAADVKTKVTDFTDPNTLKDRTDGELYYIIKNGKGDMPPEGERGKPDQLWNLVNYVRSLAKKKDSSEEKPAEKPAEEKPAEQKQ